MAAALDFIRRGELHEPLTKLDWKRMGLAELAPPKKFVNTLKIKLVIAYDGTGYEGWQVQKTGTGVQEKVETALAKLFPSTPRLHSASRTDTGVHALGMTAHFEIPGAEIKMSVRQLTLALNAWLPADIRVLSASRMPEKFHARFDAAGKQYRYFVWNHPATHPRLRQRKVEKDRS